MQNFRLIPSLFSEIDAFKETYQSAILCIFFLQIFEDHFLKISSNSEVVMLEAFVELTRNDPMAT